MEGLRKWGNLRRLCLPYVANDQVLEGLARHCRQLRQLDIAGASEVTPDGLRSLCDLADTLVYLNLGGPGGQPPHLSDAAYLLVRLKRLVSLGGYPLTGKALAEASERCGEHWKSQLRFVILMREHWSNPFPLP